MKFAPLNSTITSVSELSQAVGEVQEFLMKNNLFGNGLSFAMYRGQENQAWKLEPNLCRNLKDPLELKRIEKEMVLEFHNELVKSGRSPKIQKGFLNGSHHGDWLLLQQAQHYELPTRFMDWTIKWKVALYFAVSNPNNDPFNGDFWIYMVQRDKLLTDDNTGAYRNEDPFLYGESIFLNSASLLSLDYVNKIAIKRKDSQQGRFLIQSYLDILTPIEENPIHIDNLTRLTIPSTAKEQIRAELEQIGVTKKCLYIENDTFISDLNQRLREKYGV